MQPSSQPTLEHFLFTAPKGNPPHQKPLTILPKPLSPRPPLIQIWSLQICRLGTFHIKGIIKSVCGLLEPPFLLSIIISSSAMVEHVSILHYFILAKLHFMIQHMTYPFVSLWTSGASPLFNYGQWCYYDRLWCGHVLISLECTRRSGKAGLHANTMLAFSTWLCHYRSSPGINFSK